jgi:four helix bundle protein
VQDYKKLNVWQKGHELTLDVYKVTKHFPREETYALMSQMRRASFSVPANVAEGCGRNSNAQLAQFLSIASGSAFELDYYLFLASELNYIKTEDYNAFQDKINNVCRMLNNLTKRVSTNNEQRITNNQGEV